MSRRAGARKPEKTARRKRQNDAAAWLVLVLASLTGACFSAPSFWPPRLGSRPPRSASRRSGFVGLDDARFNLSEFILPKQRQFL